MYIAFRTKRFEHSFERLKRSGKLKESIERKLEKAIDILLSGDCLPSEYKDHQLVGDLQTYRECHIKGDLLLVYQIHKDKLVLVLVDIGTHSYLEL